MRPVNTSADIPPSAIPSRRVEPMPKVTEQHREARRDQILDAAISAFAAKGFQRTSMADIIAGSGMSAGAIYLHFGSKEDLALAVAQRIIGHRMEEFASRAGGDPLPAPSELLRAMFLGLAAELPDTSLIVQLWGEAVTEPRFSEVLGPVFLRMRELLLPYLTRWARESRGLDEADAAVWAGDTVLVLLGLVQGYLLQSALLPGFDGDHYLRGVDALLGGHAA